MEQSAPELNARPELNFKKAMTPTVLVLALGFMIDAFDLLLYNMVRVPSLTELGLSGDALTKTGIFILNCQVAGILLGGIFFGILGDKFGRKRAVLWSILLYSIATFFCAFVQSADSYAFWRFVVGFGLSGEIGLGLTLIAETLPTRSRGLGIGIFSFVAFIGVLLSGVLSSFLDWRICYLVAGIAGLLLMIARTLILESVLYKETKNQGVRHGHFIDLFKSRARALRFLACIFILMPYFFITNVLVTLSPEIAKSVGIAEPVKANIALMLGVGCGLAADIFGTVLSQVWRSRKKVLLLFMVFSLITALIYLHLPYRSAFQFYVMVTVMSLGNFWVLITMSAVEQFGTNLRATASTSSLNAGRATLIISNLLFLWLKPIGTVQALTLMSLGVFSLGFLSLYFLKETFSREMDFLE